MLPFYMADKVGFSTIKIWDCRAGRDAKSIAHYNYDGDSNRPRGIADMRLDHSGTRLFSLCMDGR